MRQASSIPKDDLGVASPMAKAVKSGASQNVVSAAGLVRDAG